jgi:hypothetical protein
MSQEPMQDPLKRHVLSVFLTALAYNPSLTLGFFEQASLTVDFFNQVITLSNTFINTYERKTFIIGLTSALNADLMPPSMAPLIIKIIQSVIAMLHKLKEQESKALKKAGKKEIKVDDDEDDDDEDDEEDDD